MKTRERIRLLSDEPGEDRLASLVEHLKDDVAGLRLPNPPAAVGEALQAFDDAVALAERVPALRLAAEAEAAKQREADVARVAAAIQAGKTPTFKDVGSARDVDAAAALSAEAAESLLVQAHDDLVEAAHAAWPSWRRELCAQAARSHKTAATAVAKARDAVETARELYGAVTTLDHELLARFPDERAQAEAERRAGLPWYSATHDAPAPLKHMATPGARPGPNGKRPGLPIADVLDELAAAVGRPADFPAASWRPPNDSSRETDTEQLDPSLPWVRRAVIREAAGICTLCGQAGADAATADEHGRLAAVHDRCAKAPPTRAELQRQQQLAAWRREGYPAQP